MPTPYAFEREPYRKTLSTQILEVGLDGERPFAVLEDTILYPEGGGQPADRGRLGTVEVTDVQKGDGGPRHYLATAVEPGPAEVQLDWDRRFDHMQQHSAQHLITALALDHFGWKTTSFHLSEEVVDIELDVESLSQRQIDALEELVAAEIRAARPIRARRVEPEEMASLPVRSRGLPAGHVGSVRLIEIEGIDLNTCGGTHLASTAEIECVKLLGTEPMRGGTRLYWVAGARARRRLGQREALLTQLRKIVGAADDELAEVIAGKLEGLKLEQRRTRHLEGQLAESLGAALAAKTQQGEGPRVVHRHLEGAQPSLLQHAGRHFAAQAGASAALLTATNDGNHFFLLALGEDSPLDLRQAGSRVAELLEGAGRRLGADLSGEGGVAEAERRSSGETSVRESFEQRCPLRSSTASSSWKTSASTWPRRGRPTGLW